MNFSNNTKEKHWNTYYSSANDSEIGKNAYRRIDTPEKREKMLVDETKKGV